MRPLPILFVLILFLPALTFAPGCAKKDVDNPEDLPKGTFSRAKGGTPSASKVPIKAGDGVINGQVVLQGDKPAMAINPKMKEHVDHAGCLAGAEFEKIDQQWIIGPNNGVANVVIFLKAPAGKYFELKEEDKKRTDKVELDQPHCAFVPHVAAAFPSYWDGKELQPSGQQFVVKNSAPFPHNTQWFGDPLGTGTGNVTLTPKTGELTFPLIPQSEPIKLACSIHPWMTAKVWTFDHPYAAVTKADGKFEIKNVPTGVELRLFAWHEAKGFFNAGDKEGMKQTFNKDENKVDFTISAK